MDSALEHARDRKILGEKDMASLRTEAESLAIALELSLLHVADAVRWADRQIELSDIPPSSLCDVAMASSKFPQDVAHMLRSIPGDCDYAGAVHLTLGYALKALKESTSDPRDVARALFDMAMASDLPEGDLKYHAFGYWDASGRKNSSRCCAEIMFNGPGEEVRARSRRPARRRASFQTTAARRW